ncbi:hypothetical protein [Pseudomonas helleri]|uniref:DUF7946 domain-containing protein n=1 Tax=Pseudomonas helleri TaxID=1608996 RepID=UPI0024315980|nr:hypothetical protein [Pseudomonas helleri]
MNFTFNVKFDTGESNFDGLNMYYGADALSGFAEAISITTHAIVNNNVVTQTPAVKGFKLDFKEAHTGSYIQKVCLEFTDAEAVRVVNHLRPKGFIELLNFHLAAPLGLNPKIVSDAAIRWHRSSMDDSEKLLDRLVGPLKKIHHPVYGQGYKVVLYKDRTPMLGFNANTFDYLTGSTINDRVEVVEAAVSRFNARTFTGRIIEAEDADSISFAPLKAGLVRPSRVILVNSLKDLTEGKFTKVGLEVRRVLSRDGRTKHLIVQSVHEL